MQLFLQPKISASAWRFNISIRKPFYDIDNGLALNQLPVWAPNAAIRRKILVENPARLYDF